MAQHENAKLGIWAKPSRRRNLGAWRKREGGRPQDSTGDRASSRAASRHQIPRISVFH